MLSPDKLVEHMGYKLLTEASPVRAWHTQPDARTIECVVLVQWMTLITHDFVNFSQDSLFKQITDRG